jgi:hypothetical protein
MQMPNATPQGLAGLMQQRPQGQPQGQPPMPSPNKASPMAGLGGVDDRVAAYAGNTKPLEQRYAMSQDLLDLLALQKIKSQKEAAARQMQLQMAQQQAQSGQGSMTVAQQREQEVDALTKNELAQQRGNTAQQQTQQQQDKMKQMMSGIAGAPGAAMAAQPTAMAAGGIVGYAGPEGSQVQDPLALARQRAEQALAKLRTFGLRQRKENPEGYQAAERESQQAQDAVATAERDLTGGAAGVLRRPMGAGPVPAGPAPVPAGADAVADRPPAAPPAAAGPANLPPAAVVAAAQNAPKPPAPPGLPGMPGAAGAAAAPPQIQPGAVGPANNFGKRLEAAALKNAEIDPAVAQAAEEKRVEGRMALTPEQRKVYEEGIGGLQKMYGEQYDPERQRQEGLKRFLIGAGGRRYGELGGGAATAMDYDEKQRTAKLKEFGDVQTARTGLIGIDRANVKGGIEAGQKAYEQSSMTQRQGADSGARMYGEDVKSRDSLYSIDVGSRDKALDRDIDRLKIAVQKDTNAAARESLSFDKARTIYSATLSRVQELERRIDDGFAKQYGMLLMQEQTGKLDPAQKNQLDTGRLQLDQQKAKLRKELEPVLESARQKLGVTGGGSSDGFGEMKKVESKNKE